MKNSYNQYDSDNESKKVSRNQKPTPIEILNEIKQEVNDLANIEV